MATLLIHKSAGLNGQVTAPGSKSQSIRALILATLATGRSTLRNFLHAEDTADAIRVCRELGATIHVAGDCVTVEGSGLPVQTLATRVDTGNSGITTRFIMPLLGLRREAARPVTLTCGAQMRARPNRPLIDALQRLGMTIHYLESDATLPVRISGELKGGAATVDGLTSQYISALLLALPCAANDSTITVPDLHERPYMEMTLRWLQQQGIAVDHQRKKTTDIFRIRGGQRYHAFGAAIPGDFSSASYMMAAGVLTAGAVTVRGLDMQDPQGDKRLVAILQQMGADIEIRSDALLIRGGRPLTGARIDANDIPDLLPTLAVIGTQTSTPLEIYNVRQARIKETDRIQSMTEGLRRLGAHVTERDDGMTVTPGPLTAARLRGFGDHRTVMALAVAGLLADGETEIEDAEAIDKTNPGFVAMMRSLGAAIEVRDAG